MNYARIEILRRKQTKTKTKDNYSYKQDVDIFSGLIA
jgi:hypothetical protein